MFGSFLFGLFFAQSFILKGKTLSTYDGHEVVKSFEWKDDKWVEVENVDDDTICFRPRVLHKRARTDVKGCVPTFELKQAYNSYSGVFDSMRYCTKRRGLSNYTIVGNDFYCNPDFSHGKDHCEFMFTKQVTLSGSVSNIITEENGHSFTFDISNSKRTAIEDSFSKTLTDTISTSITDSHTDRQESQSVLINSIERGFGSSHSVGKSKQYSTSKEDSKSHTDHSEHKLGASATGKILGVGYDHTWGSSDTNTHSTSESNTIGTSSDDTSSNSFGISSTSQQVNGFSTENTHSETRENSHSEALSWSKSKTYEVGLTETRGRVKNFMKSVGSNTETSKSVSFTAEAPLTLKLGDSVRPIMQKVVTSMLIPYVCIADRNREIFYVEYINDMYPNEKSNYLLSFIRTDSKLEQKFKPDVPSVSRGIGNGKTGTVLRSRDYYQEPGDVLIREEKGEKIILRFEKDGELKIIKRLRSEDVIWSNEMGGLEKYTKRFGINKLGHLVIEVLASELFDSTNFALYKQRFNKNYVTVWSTARDFEQFKRIGKYDKKDFGYILLLTESSNIELYDSEQVKLWSSDGKETKGYKGYQYPEYYVYPFNTDISEPKLFIEDYDQRNSNYFPNTPDPHTTVNLPDKIVQFLEYSWNDYEVREEANGLYIPLDDIFGLENVQVEEGGWFSMFKSKSRKAKFITIFETDGNIIIKDIGTVPKFGRGLTLWESQSYFKNKKLFLSMLMGDGVLRITDEQHKVMWVSSLESKKGLFKTMKLIMSNNGLLEMYGDNNKIWDNTQTWFMPFERNIRHYFRNAPPIVQESEKVKEVKQASHSKTQPITQKVKEVVPEAKPQVLYELSIHGCDSLTKETKLRSQNHEWEYRLNDSGVFQRYYIKGGANEKKGGSIVKGSGCAPYTLRCQNDGNLVLYDRDSKSVWNTGASTWQGEGCNQAKLYVDDSGELRMMSEKDCHKKFWNTKRIC